MWKLIALLLLHLSPFSAALAAGPVLVSGDAPPDLLRDAQDKLTGAQAFFTKNIQPGDFHLEAEVNGHGYRTGYSFQEKKILFPQLEGVLRFGLDSQDVLTHESFHALLCQWKPALCTTAILGQPETVALHEALADLFAYFREPDAEFGEGYRAGKAYLRKYRTSLVLGLCEETYLRENALVSLLLANHFGLGDLKAFLQQEDFSFAAVARFSAGAAAQLGADRAKTIEATPLNYPASDLWRFRVKPEEPLRLRVKPSKELTDAYPNWEARVTLEDGSVLPGTRAKRLADGPGFELEIPVSAGHPPLKAFLSSWDGDQMLGAKTIYLAQPF